MKQIIFLRKEFIKAIQMVPLSLYVQAMES